MVTVHGFKVERVRIQVLKLEAFNAEPVKAYIT
jgi:hypothetical protein